MGDKQNSEHLPRLRVEPEDTTNFADATFLAIRNMCEKSFSDPNSTHHRYMYSDAKQEILDEVQRHQKRPQPKHDFQFGALHHEVTQLRSEEENPLSVTHPNEDKAALGRVVGLSRLSTVHKKCSAIRGSGASLSSNSLNAQQTQRSQVKSFTSKQSNDVMIRCYETTNQTNESSGNGETDTQSKELSDDGDAGHFISQIGCKLMDTTIESEADYLRSLTAESLAMKSLAIDTESSESEGEQLLSGGSRGLISQENDKNRLETSRTSAGSSLGLNDTLEEVDFMLRIGHEVEAHKSQSTNSQPMKALAIEPLAIEPLAIGSESKESDEEPSQLSGGSRGSILSDTDEDRLETSRTSAGSSLGLNDTLEEVEFMLRIGHEVEAHKSQSTNSQAMESLAMEPLAIGSESTESDEEQSQLSGGSRGSILSDIDEDRLETSRTSTGSSLGLNNTLEQVEYLLHIGQYVAAEHGGNNVVDHNAALQPPNNATATSVFPQKQNALTIQSGKRLPQVELTDNAPNNTGPATASPLKVQLSPNHLNRFAIKELDKTGTPSRISQPKPHLLHRNQFAHAVSPLEQCCSKATHGQKASAFRELKSEMRQQPQQIQTLSDSNDVNELPPIKRPSQRKHYVVSQHKHYIDDRSQIHSSPNMRKKLDDMEELGQRTSTSTRIPSSRRNDSQKY